MVPPLPAEAFWAQARRERVIVAVLTSDLLFGSRILSAAEEAGADVRRYSSPANLPPAGDVGLLLVDWGARGLDWGAALSEWRASAPEPRQLRIVLYGPHTNLEAHAVARAAGLGPMWARSKLLNALPSLLTSGR